MRANSPNRSTSPSLRASLKAQMVDEMVREAGADVQTNPSARSR